MSRAATGTVDVCLTNPFAWPQVKRGSETVIRSLAVWLDHSGRRVEIAAGGPESSSYRLDAVPVTLVRARSMKGIHRDLDEETTIIPALSRSLHRMNPTLVHSFMYVDATAARLARRPYVVSYGGIATRRLWPGHPLKRALFRFASSGARVILTPSAAAADHLYATYGLRSRVVPNGFGIADFPLCLDERAPYILCTASPNDERKRVSVLIDAFTTVHARQPSFELVLAGPASDARQRELLARVPAAVQERIRFAGDLDTDELCRLYQHATVTCLPSLNEAFGLVLIESLACGTPVVATRSGAIPEIIDETVGALFEADDVSACATALVETIGRTDDRDLRTACRERAERYDWSAIGPQLLEVYAEVAG